MFLKRRLFRFAALAGIGLLSMGAVACHHGRGSPEEKVDWVGEKVADKLDLDAPQKAKLDVVKANLKEGLVEFGKTRKDARAVLREELGKETMDAARITESLRAGLDVVSRRLPSLVESVVDLHASLGAEQKAKVRDVVGKRLERDYDEKR